MKKDTKIALSCILIALCIPLNPFLFELMFGGALFYFALKLTVWWWELMFKLGQKKANTRIGTKNGIYWFYRLITFGGLVEQQIKRQH